MDRVRHSHLTVSNYLEKHHDIDIQRRLRRVREIHRMIVSSRSIVSNCSGPRYKIMRLDVWPRGQDPEHKLRRILDKIHSSIAVWPMYTVVFHEKPLNA